jgi:hypothetical protein
LLQFTAHPKAHSPGEPFTGKNCDETDLFGVLRPASLRILNSPNRLPPINFRSRPSEPSFASKFRIMKKIILGAALLLSISFTYASAAALAPQTGRPPVVRNITSTELPAALLTGIKNDYKDYWITECTETGKKNREEYFITLENADQTLQLKSSDRSSWEVVSTKIKE